MADDTDPMAEVLGDNAQGQLRSFVERLERLQADVDEVKEDIKEVFQEAKGNGFDVKTIRKVLKIRRMDRAKRQEEEAILDLYLAALGLD